MTSIKNTLALYLVNENFGEKTKEVAAFLIIKNGCPFNLLAEDLKIDKKSLAKILSILTTHFLVEYKLNEKQLVEYRFNTNKAIDRLKISGSINLVKKTYENDRNSEFLVNELYTHGRLEMSTLILKCLIKNFNETELKTKANDSNEIYANNNLIMTAFNKLANDQFIERIPELTNDTNDDMQGINKKKHKIPRYVSQAEYEATKFMVPDIDIQGDRIKKSINEDNELITCKLRRSDETFGDDGILWRINEKRMIQYFRDQALINAFENRIDQNAANIMRVIFQLSDTHVTDKAEGSLLQSKPVTAIDIQKIMRTNYKMDSIIVDKYLSVILQDSFKVIEKIGDFSGGAYCVDFKKALTNLCLAHIESYVREKYDSKSLRIFRVILEKSKLEQKQIEDFSMIPSKECKALVYNMLNDGLLTIVELSKTADHAPSRTYYLFQIDVFHIAKKLLENSYKSMKNLMIKREQLTNENKKLLEKNRKINLRIESLIAQGAEQQEIVYEKSIMSNEENNQLSSFTAHCNKIELAEVQLEETIFLFEHYFYYHTVAPVPPVPKKR